MDFNRSQLSGAQDQADLMRQMAEMKAELEQYKSEMTALRGLLAADVEDDRPTVYKTQSATSRRRLIKQMVAGAAGVSALAMAAAIGSTSQVQAATSTDNAIEAEGGASGYGGKFTGGAAPIKLEKSAAAGAPYPSVAAPHEAGELYVDSEGSLFFSFGTPLAWRKVAGPRSSGAMHILATPLRIVDTRTALGATKPAVDNAILTITAGGVGGAAGVPAGATAVFGALGIVSPTNVGTPYATVYSADLGTTPLTANLVYPGGISVSTTFAVNLGTGGNANKFKIYLRRITDVTVDIQGYYL